jgi:hypothetical protein
MLQPIPGRRTKTHLKNQLSPRERIPIDVQEVFVLVRLLARDALPSDVVRIPDGVGVAVVRVR